MSFWDTTNIAKPKGVKDPNAILDYPISWVAWIGDVGDAIQSHTVVNLTGGLTLVSSSAASGVVTVWLSGGVVGETASFTVRIITVGGRTDDRTFYLKIKER